MTRLEGDMDAPVASSITSIGPLEDGHGAQRFVEADPPAAVFLQCQARARHLALARLTTQLRDEFGGHGEAGRADRVALRDESTGGVGRDAPVGAAGARGDEWAA